MKHKILYLILFLVSVFSYGCATRPLESEKFTIQKFLQKDPTHTVIVVHGSGGASLHEFNWAKQLQSFGYNAIILDSYSSRNIESHTGKALVHFTVDDRAREVIKLTEWISQQTWHRGKIGVIGFSQGGSVVLAVSSALRMKTMHKIAPEKLNNISFGIAYYPGCMLVAPDHSPQFPLQIHFAELDDLAQPWRCYPNTLVHKNYQLNFYAQARHSFDYMRSDVITSNGKHFSYNKNADLESRKKVQQFIISQFGKN